MRVAASAAWRGGALILMCCLAPAPPAAAEPAAAVPARPEPAAAAEGGPLLGARVDAATYVLGPDDVLRLSVPGVLESSAVLVVDAEGGLVLPGSAGRVEVAGLTLEAARRAVGAALASLVRDRAFALSLERPRRFKVYVTGAVREPGAIAASPATRVSEVIDAAGGIRSEGSRRRIRIRRADGTGLGADLARFGSTGDGVANPFLEGGDVVHVPVRTEEFAVFGGVASPGIYELVDGETIESAIALAGGRVPGSGTAGDWVSRVEGDRRVTHEVSGLEDDGLVAGDVVVVPALGDYRAIHQVEVSGEVRFPGRYPIQPGADTVGDLIRRAGGFTAAANRAAARLLRAAPFDFAPHAPSTPRELRQAGENAGAVDAARGVEGRAAIPPAFEDLPRTARELEFLALSVDSRDVRVAWREEPFADSTPLADGDRIHVPRAEGRVRVDGRVRAPGWVAYAPGRAAGDYVRLAGGFDGGADRGKVLIQRGGHPGRAEGIRGATPVEDGDTIWVPEKTPQGWFAVTREVVAFLAQVATVAIIIDQVTSK